MEGCGGLLAFEDGADTPVCVACAEQHSPDLVRVLRTVPLLLGGDPRARLLREYAQREPASFLRFRGGDRRQDASAIPPETEGQIRLRQTEELLEGDNTVQVFVPQGMTIQEAVRVLYRVLMLLCGSELARFGAPLGGMG